MYNDIQLGIQSPKTLKKIPAVQGIKIKGILRNTYMTSMRQGTRNLW